MEDTKTINLRKPVALGEVVYDKLELREPTATELDKASTGATGIGSVINLISLVAKVPRKVAEGLCQRDLREANRFLESFSEDDLRTGESESPT